MLCSNDIADRLTWNILQKMPTDKWGWRGMRITVEHSFSTIRVYTGVQAGDHRGNWRDEYQITVCAYFIYTHLSFHEYIGSSK